MAELGSISLLLALVLAVYSAVGSSLGAWRKIPDLVRSARYATYLSPLTLMISTSCLVGTFLRNEYSIRYVAEHSNSAMPRIYTWVAFYAGNEGSLLYIALALSVLAALAVALAGRSTQGNLPYTTTILMASLTFFLIVLVTLADPFTRLEIPPADGQGINPLLTHPGMFFHPPMLMLGLVGVTIPFAFAMGHLISGETGDGWIGAGHRWGLIIWAVLTIGLLLGSWWAYTILGWGGYWAWDPVENAGLLPWLPLTAFIHSAMVQKRRGMFRMWNIALLNIAQGMALYGMFVNRGGPVPSVHSFAQSTMGWVMLAYLGITLLTGFAIFFWRYNRLHSESTPTSPLSRESAFLLNNLLFVAISFVVLWGVVFPLLSQALRGQVVTVARPFYDTVTGPLFLALVILMGIGPLLPWRHSTLRNLGQALLLPVTLGVLTIALLAILGLRTPLPMFAFGCCVFVSTGILREWFRGTQVRRGRGESYPLAFVRLIAANRPRYGGYIAHLAVILLALSATGSSYYSIEETVALSPGDNATVGGYKLEYLDTSSKMFPDRIERIARLNIYREGNFLETLKPWRAFYPDFDMSATRAGIRSTPVEDLYIIVSEFAQDGAAVFEVRVKPLMIWMWLSGPMFLLGALIALWPERKRAGIQIHNQSIAKVPTR